jgi:hypothetical protein
MAVNVKKQIDVADDLISLGFIPFVPLLYHFQHMVHPRSYEEWVKIDLEWVTVCNCLLRLPGESKGADGEVEQAKEIGIPVFYEINDLISYYCEN